MSLSPLVSIGLPVFNGERHISRAIDSLLAQSWPNLELNISDNASTDRTREICQDYCRRDKRVLYYRNPANLGLLPNWRRALELSSGEFFMWAACDDWFSDDYVAVLVHCLCSNEKAVLAAGKTVHVDASGHSRADVEPNAAPSAARGGRVEAAKQLLRQHAISWLHGLYRREALLELPPTLFVERDWGSDVLFLLETCLSHEVTGSDRTIIYKRLAGLQAGAPRTPIERVQWQCWYAGALLRVIVKSPISQAQKLTMLGAYWRYLKYMYLRKGMYSFVKLWAQAGYQVVSAGTGIRVRSSD